MHVLKASEVTTNILTIGEHELIYFAAYTMSDYQRDKYVVQCSSTPLLLGMHIENLSFKGLAFTTFDVGGRSPMRLLYRHLYKSTDAIIFVVDLANREVWYMEQAKNELSRMLAEDELIGKPLLVLGNKVDLSTAMTQEDLEMLLDLKKVRETRDVSVRRVSFLHHKANPRPIESALEWLRDSASGNASLASLFSHDKTKSCAATKLDTRGHNTVSQAQ